MSGSRNLYRKTVKSPQVALIDSVNNEDKLNNILKRNKYMYNLIFPNQ